MFAETELALRKKSGRGFNIFAVLHTEHDEVRITRVICELLDPNGSHAQGVVFLRQFVECVLLPHMENVSFTDADYEGATVEREYSIVNGRRIDLFLSIGACRIPIEVKIYAGDQQCQCQDYYEYAVGSPIFYLTLDGHEPSEYSTGTLQNDKVQTISFEKDILRWLESCLCQPTIVPLAPIREMLLQFLDVIRKQTGQVEDSMQAELEKIICKNGETLFGAAQINRIFQVMEKKMIYMIFEELDAQITQKYQLTRVMDKTDYTKRKTWQGISYLFAHPAKEYFLGLRAELLDNGKMAVGVCTHDQEGHISLEKSTFDKLRNVVSGQNWIRPSKGCWIVWQYVEANDAPDFKAYNQAYCDLIESDKRKQFIDDCMVLVDAIADGLKPPYKIEKR